MFASKGFNKAILAYFAEEAYDAVTPDKTVYKEFSDGAFVMEVDGTTMYMPSSDMVGEKEFTQFEDESMNRQQANIYGTIVE